MATPTYFAPSYGHEDWLNRRAASCDRLLPHVTRSNKCRHYHQQHSLPSSPLPVLYSSDRVLNQMLNQFTRINEHLYLSGFQAITPDRIRMYGITQIVTAMVDPLPSDLKSEVPNTMHVNVEDMETANLRVHFDTVSDRILREAKRGGRTLVHCMAGISRSSSLVMAYLMKHQNMSLYDAYTLVKQMRPIISPNLGFWRQLISYEENKRGSRSMKVTTDETSWLNVPYNSLRTLGRTDSYSLDRSMFKYPGYRDTHGQYTSTYNLPRRNWSNRLSDYSRY